MSEVSKEEYVNFMYDPKNIMNCSDCPENSNFSSWPGTRLPCGQFNCWVGLHCKEEDEDE